MGRSADSTLGNEDVEDEAFKLHPGEMTTLIGTPEGNVVFKLDKRDSAEHVGDAGVEASQADAGGFRAEGADGDADRLSGSCATPPIRKVMLKDQNKPVDLVAIDEEFALEVAR